MSETNLTLQADNTLSQFKRIEAHISQHIIGQKQLINRLLIALLADGHLLVEGAPGLAKTKMVKHLAEIIEGDFHRIQFTPDLLPADITGTDIFVQHTNDFSFLRGPIFNHIILADEINRAPAKVQSALLEAMAERQVTVGKKTYALPDLFIVMATQNQLEQEGTHPLPEAQLDRFLLYTQIDYPNAQEEKEILRLSNQVSDKPAVQSQVPQSVIFQARKAAQAVHIEPILEDYLVELVMATRQPEVYDATLADWIASGASPRGSLALLHCAKANAWLAGRDYVTPGDIQNLATDVLAHRIVLNFSAIASGVSATQVIEKILKLVAAP